MICDSNILNEIDEAEVAVSFRCDIQDLKKHVPSTKLNLTIASQNIRSVYRNFDDFILTLMDLEMDLDILVLTECRICAHKPIPLLDSYFSQYTIHTSNQNDGVVTYIKTHLNAKAKEIIIEHATCIQIQIQNTVILGIYRSPSNLSAQNFIYSLNNHLETLKSFKTIIITGDININLISRDQEPTHENLNRQYYLNMLSSHGILPGHTIPTRLTSCLDHFMLKLETGKTTAQIAILNTSVTDHLTIFLALTTDNLTDYALRNTVTINYDKAIKNILRKNIDILLVCNDPYYVVQQLISKMNQSLQESKTIKLIPRSKRVIKPWITPGILRCIKARNRLQLKTRSEPHNEILKVTFKRYRNFCNNLIKKLKRKYERDQLANSAKNSKTLWKTIKNITHYKSTKIKNTELLNNNTSPTISVNNVNNFFGEIGKTLAENINNSIYSDDMSNSNYLPLWTTSSLVLLDTDPQEVGAIIMSLRTESAPGWDNIPTKFLKLLKNQVAPVISHLANLCFSTGMFPGPLKQSIVTPVYKSGERDDVNNYRPISVLPAISKIIEKLINNRLIAYLNKFNIISDFQFGFRRSRSTEDAILSLTNLIVDKIESGKKCLAVFLDLKKAFDTVSLPTLVCKMERVGIRGLPLRLLSDYLHGRTQKTKLGDHISNEVDITFGVPQGSILGPTLFLIYINDLINLKINHGNIQSYADDTVIVFEGDSWESVFVNANVGLCKVSSWLKSNLLTLNVNKTNYICFTKYDNTQPHVNQNLKIHTCSPTDNLLCNCRDIERVSSTKYLGVILDQRLSWHQHIEFVNGRIRKLVWIFKILRHVANKTLLNQLYVTLAESIMTYCITVWGGATKSKFLEVERGQRCLLKVMYLRPYRFPTFELYKISDQLSMRKLYILHTILKLHKTLECNPTLLTRRRKNTVAPLTAYKSLFAKRQYKTRSAYLYNKINVKINIYQQNKYNGKKSLTEWLKMLSYEDTELLLNLVLI
jgi:hypothetical protein